VALTAAEADITRYREAAEAGDRQVAEMRARAGALAPHREALAQQVQAALGADATVSTEGGRVVLQPDDLFAPRTVRLSEAGEERLRVVAQALAQATAQIPGDLPWVLSVESHTDGAALRRGSAFRSNWDLSTQRAGAVAEFLEAQGVPADRIAAAGFGGSRPVEPGSDEAARQRNRRIELRLAEG
jgi:chemotaxis protein MotB